VNELGASNALFALLGGRALNATRRALLAFLGHEVGEVSGGAGGGALASRIDESLSVGLVTLGAYVAMASEAVLLGTGDTVVVKGLELGRTGEAALRVTFKAVLVAGLAALGMGISELSLTTGLHALEVGGQEQSILALVALHVLGIA